MDEYFSDFFDIPIDELGQFHCPACGGEGKKKVQMGGVRLCPTCFGCGYAPAAVMARLQEKIVEGSLGGDFLAEPVSPEAMLVDALGAEWHGMLEEVAARNFRSPRQQVLFWIKDASR